MTEELKACRETIAAIDMEGRIGWAQAINALFDGGFTVAELETDICASQNTLAKWATGRSAPRRLTRKSLQKMFLEMIDERLPAPPSRPTPADAGEVRSDLEQALRWAYLAGATDVHNYWSGGGELPRGDPEFGEAASDYAKAALDPFSSAARVADAILSLLSPTILVEDVGELEEGWQPIETAPKDGTRVHLGFVHMGGFDVIAHWTDGDWALDGSGSYATRLLGRPFPSAWRPLPAAPGRR